MKRRSNPWPALVDLFGALLVVTFGGLMMLYGQAKAVVQKGQNVEDRLFGIRESLSAPGAAGALPLSRRGCEPDVCIDIGVKFESDDDAVSIGQSSDLQRLAERLVPELEKIPFSDRQYVQLVVEGHTDSSNLVPEKEPRKRFMKNWELSSRRASSVLFELQKYGLSPTEYGVISIGYADSQPIEKEELSLPVIELERRRQTNRRTTLRIQYRPPVPLDVRQATAGRDQ